MNKSNKDPFGIKVLIVYDDMYNNTGADRALDLLCDELEKRSVEVMLSPNAEDAEAILIADNSIQCALINWDNEDDKDHKQTTKLLQVARERNSKLPIFLMANRTVASEIPFEVMQLADDYIWLLEDTSDFIAGRVMASVKRYRDLLPPPMFKALMDFAKVHEYSWHTPGHTGGTAFLKAPAGCQFFSFYGEEAFRSDLSISVGELGSLLDHSGPIGESEKYMAKVFGSHRSYHVTNGSSTSNRVILMASVTRNQIALCDRNCHKSAEHAMTMSGAIPTYLVPVRNHLGIIGPIRPEKLTPEGIKASINSNPLVKDGMDKTPVHAIITNSTYDGVCYNVKKVTELLGQSVDRLHFDEAWYSYARFNHMYKDRFAMYGDPAEYGSNVNKNHPTVFATQSTHKLLAAFSQASMIHIRDGKNPIEHSRFNEAFMMHASTSPFYAIIASNDVSAAMMESSGETIIRDAMQDAVTFRQTVARINAEAKAKNDWFFNIWQPDTVTDPKTKKKMAFHEAPEELLVSDPSCWELKANDVWHGFGDIEDGYAMLDPIKVSITTPGMTPKGLEKTGIPAPILTAYLDHHGIIAEKTTDFTVLMLFSLGITKGKWGTLLTTLLNFKRDYDTNAPLAQVLPHLVKDYPEVYGKMGLKDLADHMFKIKAELNMTKIMSDAFSTLPKADCSPVEAFEELVRNNVEEVAVNDLSGRIVATGVVPYPPGIPLLMPGEIVDGPTLGYLKALDEFDRHFPGFTHDTHGVEVKDGIGYVVCVKK